ncbi:MAG: hypothetical protein AAB589_02260 [Patescibacteria group bacterium]
MATSKPKKTDFSKADPNHLMAIIEDFHDKVQVMNEVNQTMGKVVARLDSLEDKTEKIIEEQKITNARLGNVEDRIDKLETSFDDLSHEMKSNFETVFLFLSKADPAELQERVVKIEKKLEMR